MEESSKGPATRSQKPELFRLHEIGDQPQNLPLFGRLDDNTSVGNADYPLYVRPVSALNGDIFTSATATRYLQAYAGCEQDNSPVLICPDESRRLWIQSSDVQDEVSEECEREKQGPTQDEERQEDPASASSSEKEQLVPVVLENIDLSTKDVAKSLVWDPTDIQFSDRSWELKADDLGPYQLLPVKFLLPDLYLDNLEGVEFEEGDIDTNVSDQISEGSISLSGAVEFRSRCEISFEDTGEQSLAKEESDVLDQPANNNREDVDDPANNHEFSELERHDVSRLAKSHLRKTTSAFFTPAPRALPLSELR